MWNQLELRFLAWYIKMCAVTNVIGKQQDCHVSLEF